MLHRCDIELELAKDLDAETSAIIKTGDPINIVKLNDGQIEIYTAAQGRLIGTVPPTQAEQLANEDFSGSIRTLKRDPETKTIASIIVRFVQGDNSIKSIVNAPCEQLENDDDEEENIRKLSREQLTQLANNPEIQRYLRDERLQKVILEIDQAQNREAALKSMMKAPNFKEFTDKLLEQVAGPSNPLEM